MTDPIRGEVKTVFSPFDWPQDSFFSNPENQEEMEYYRKSNEALRQLTAPFAAFPDWDENNIDALSKRLERFAKGNSNSDFNFSFYTMARKDPRVVALALLQLHNSPRVAQLLMPLKYFLTESYNAILWYLAEYNSSRILFAKEVEQWVDAIQISNASALMPHETIELKIKVLSEIAKRRPTSFLPDNWNLTGRYNGFVITGVVRRFSGGQKELTIFVSLGEKEMAPEEAHPAKISETYLNLFDSFQYSQDILNVMEYLYPDGNFVLKVDFESGEYHAFFDPQGAYNYQFFISY